MFTVLSSNDSFSLISTRQIPGTINQYLHHYQQNGVTFLWNHYKERKGCILADDMGLGKTIQVKDDDLNGPLFLWMNSSNISSGCNE